MNLTFFLLSLIYLALALALAGYALYEMPAWSVLDRRLRTQALTTALGIGLIWPMVLAMLVPHLVETLIAWVKKPRDKPTPLRKEKR